MKVCRKHPNVINRTLIGRIAIILICVPWAMHHHLKAQAPGAADRVAPDHPATASIPAAQATFVPMTEGERLRRYFKDDLNPVSLLSAGASAGIGQWRDRPKKWGQGAEGYGTRYASAFAGHMVCQTLIFGASSLLHEDNRYLPSEPASAGRRVEYAVASTFLARRDDGRRRVSVSRIIGLAGAAFISRSWQPRGNRSFRSGLGSLTTSTSVTVGFNVAREFLPFLRSQ